MLVNLCAETIKPVSEEDKILTAVEGKASVYQEYPVSRTTGEAREEIFEAWGPGAGGSGVVEGGEHLICAAAIINP